VATPKTKPSGKSARVGGGVEGVRDLEANVEEWVNLEGSCVSSSGVAVGVE
jgi:hypothetical protein